MAITRWDPFGDLVSLREAMNRLLEESYVRPSSGSAIMEVSGRTFPVDLYETGEAIIVTAALPGAKPEDVDVSIADNVLTMKAEVKEETDIQRDQYLIKERRRGSFLRQITLPTIVDADKAQASFEDGVLTLNIPKAEKVKPKTIKVTPQSS